MELALTLTHNLGPIRNAAQITTLLTLITPVVELIDGEDTVMPVYDLTGTLHRVRFYQVVPFGVTPPSNLDSLSSRKVFYKAGDDDKTGTHPRFVNWGLQRGFSEGAQVCLYITSAATFNIVELETHLAQLRDSMVWREPTWGKIIAPRLLREVGLLDETLTFDDALLDLRSRIDDAGLGRGEPPPVIHGKP